jgi:hypothetical protein
MLICYSIVGFVVYVTLLLLGEMATQYPVAGKDRLPLPVSFSTRSFVSRVSLCRDYPHARVHRVKSRCLAI